ncbi:MAG: imidazolonepropionase [Endozoicomonas sp. (ex Botrylloides leachii)]|nr:imidazolonepropionase [Endozoicomonas sp. (ex Botrylloides leachii)]
MKQPAGKIIHHINIATMDPDNRLPYGTIHTGAIVISDDTIIWVGKEQEVPNCYASYEKIDGNNQWLTPGLIDCHTHLVFAGNRAQEFEQRLQGVSYEKIASQGGGIQSTVRATRQASEETLYNLSASRLFPFLAEGVTTMEIKSGYGLNLETECRQLRVARLLGENLPITIKTTFLGAHTLPEEFYGHSDDYIEHICNDMIPTIASAGLADAIDAFCERIAFSYEQVQQVFEAAKKYRLPVKIHAEQLSNLHGSVLSAKYQGLSADHLEHLDQIGINAMKSAGTVATLLPGAFYNLRETVIPPVTQLREAGVPIAIASDFNPGSSPLASLRLMMHMACTLFRLTPEEALLGCTRNAAMALGLSQMGVIREGYKADLVLWPIEHPAELVCHFGTPSPSQIIQHGRWL